MKLIIFEGATADELRSAREEIKRSGFLLTNSMPKIVELGETDPLDEIFVEQKMTELVPKVKSKAWKKKFKKTKVRKEIPNKRTKWTDEIIERVREVVGEMSNNEINELLRREFGINVEVTSLANMMFNKGISRKNKVVKDEPVKEFEKPKLPKSKSSKAKAENSKRKGMPEEVVEYIEDNYMKKTDDELRDSIADKFGSFWSVDKIEAYRETNGMARPDCWNSEDYDEE